MKTKNVLNVFLLALASLLTQNAFSIIIANNSGKDIYLRIRSGEIGGSIKRLSQNMEKSKNGEKENLMFNNETFILKSGTAIQVDNGLLEYPLRLRGWAADGSYSPKEDVDSKNTPIETAKENLEHSVIASLIKKEHFSPAPPEGLVIEKKGSKLQFTKTDNKKFLRTFLGDRDEEVTNFVLSNYAASDVLDFDDERLMGTCGICLDAMDAKLQQTVSTICNHVFHKKCLAEVVSKKCPLCRHENCF